MSYRYIEYKYNVNKGVKSNVEKKKFSPASTTKISQVDPFKRSVSVRECLAGLPHAPSSMVQRDTYPVNAKPQDVSMFMSVRCLARPLQKKKEKETSGSLTPRFLQGKCVFDSAIDGMSSPGFPLLSNSPQ